MNVHVFGAVILAAAIIVLAIGGFLWMTGVPDDGRYHVQADNAFDLIAKNRAHIERRRASRTSLLIGCVAFVIGGALILSARSRSAE